MPRELSDDELREIASRHSAWLSGMPGGVQADFRGVQLAELSFSGFDLRYANFSDANLTHSQLGMANLSGCCFSHACLDYADLSLSSLGHADFSSANMRYANMTSAAAAHACFCSSNLYNSQLDYASLRYADCSFAQLVGASFTDAQATGCNFRDADLREAKLDRAFLDGASFISARLAGTCLDPEAKPNAECDSFAQYGRTGFVIGYRGAYSAIASMHYEVGRVYSAPVFSVSNNACHPGLYLLPTVEMVRSYLITPCRVIKVKTRRRDIHRAGYRQYRCRWFEVLKVVK